MSEKDFERARLDPTSVFTTPEDVLEHPELDREQKIEILRRWEYDSRELEVATEEGMGGGEPALLGRVRQALHQLNAESDDNDASPTKQGGA